MKVKLSDIEPNPFRNLEQNPLQRSRIDELKRSIDDVGFWSEGVAARQIDDGKIQIAFGHHRIEAAREMFSDDHEVEIPVRTIDDSAMLKMMIHENSATFNRDSSDDRRDMRAVITAYADGHIKLDQPSKKTSDSTKRFAPSFVQGIWSAESADHPYTSTTVARFIGWNDKKVKYTLKALELIEQNHIQEVQLHGMTHNQTRTTLDDVSKAIKKPPEPPTAPPQTEQVKPTPKAEKIKVDVKTSAPDPADLPESEGWDDKSEHAKRLHIDVASHDKKLENRRVKRINGLADKLINGRPANREKAVDDFAREVIQHYQVEAEIEISKQVDEKMKREREAMKAEREKLKIQLEKSGRYQTIVTQDIHKFLIGATHSDRHAQATEQRQNIAKKAHAAIQRLGETVNLDVPLKVLKEQGWEKDCPAYKAEQTKKRKAREEANQPG